MQSVGVIVAMPQEAADILGDARFGWAAAGKDSWTSSRFPLRLEISGVGKVFAARACAALTLSCDLVVSLGTSGGLGTEAIGSLWIAREFVEHDMEASGLWYEPGVTPFAGMSGPVISSLSDEGFSRAVAASAAAGLEVAECRATSGDVFIADPLRARMLAERTGARICDMESAAEAKLCAYRGRQGEDSFAPIEFFAFRSVSDNADHQAGRAWSEQVTFAARDFDAFLYSFVSAPSP
ncbi:MAG TPA: 5'-methylthioadenosine/S-adenosylhomocysteine nucleosidase [Rectinemataceae bacterium]|nr:5'-methylthioadenosine/S-adenosylhomocysteine nucleosidase [Rectinemataceae bacterium]